MLSMEPRSKVLGRQRNPRSRPDTKIEHQFVTDGPTGHDEKADTRTIVRANAAHFHWRHNRPPRDEYKPKRPRKGAAQKHTEFSKRGRTLSKLSSPTAISSWAIDHGTANNVNQLHNSSLYPEEHRVICDQDEISLWTLSPLKNTQLGPSSSYAVELPSDFVSRCITYNAQVILPALFPDATDSFNIRTNLLQLSISHPTVFHIFVIGALIYSQGALGIIPGDRISLQVFRSRAELVRHMNIAIRDPVEACKDINILAISSLSNSILFQKVDVPAKMPKQGPLRSLQFLNSFSLTESEAVHVDGLSKLIEFKGGLGKIEMPGLAALISFMELRVATRDLTVPRYPLVTLSCPLEEFRFQHRGLGFGTDQDLYEVLSMLSSYTMMIDDFCEGRQVATAFLLIDHRNMTQHALLSLPPRVGGSECCRLAALIYCLLVTFPLPYITAPFERLVTQLQIALTGWDGDDQMLVWVLTMGGIGAIGLKERQWFVEKFHGVVMRMGVRSWEETREIVNNGLWFGATNDGDGNDFWRESQEYLKTRTPELSLGLD